MLVFLIFAPTAAATATAAAVVTDGGWPQVLAFAAFTVAVIWQSVIYVPRAWRAHRR